MYSYNVIFFPRSGAGYPGLLLFPELVLLYRISERTVALGARLVGAVLGTTPKAVLLIVNELLPQTATPSLGWVVPLFKF